MSILGNRIRGARVADLFAGSGALGLEALSRGASHVTFVERSHRAIRTLERNIRSLDAGPAATVIRGDAMSHLRTPPDPPWDLALADPPYDRGYAFRLLAGYCAAPFARELWIEHDRRETLPPDVTVEQRIYGDTALTRVTDTGGGSR